MDISALDTPDKTSAATNRKSKKRKKKFLLTQQHIKKMCRERLAQETPEQRAKRLENVRAYSKARFAIETPEEKELRRERSRLYYKKKKLQQKRWLKFREEIEKENKLRFSAMNINRELTNKLDSSYMDYLIKNDVKLQLQAVVKLEKLPQSVLDPSDCLILKKSDSCKLSQTIDTEINGNNKRPIILKSLLKKSQNEMYNEKVESKKRVVFLITPQKSVTELLLDLIHDKSIGIADKGFYISIMPANDQNLIIQIIEALYKKFEYANDKMIKYKILEILLHFYKDLKIFKTDNEVIKASIKMWDEKVRQICISMPVFE